MIATVEEFLSHSGLCFDVRSPKEYAHARIPGAQPLALFTDDERAEVGTLYKQQGKESAVRLGIKHVAPKLEAMLQEADRQNPSRQPVRIYCWRGGMRSSFVSYYLQFCGHPAIQLKGGYKAFRSYIQAAFSLPIIPLVVGGFTGAGKTEVLHHLQAIGQQIVDLEELACHRGSAYGEQLASIQPSCEQFENELACKLLAADRKKVIWIEDESRLIGRSIIPEKVYAAMCGAPLFVINSSKDLRVQRIVHEYGTFPKEQLIASTWRIQKRLGGQATKEVIKHIEHGQLADAVILLLDYYDRAYEYAIQRHHGKVIRFSESNRTPEEWAQILVAAK